VNRSAYYKWLNKKPSQREIDNKIIEATIIEITNDPDYGRIYGYRPMCAEVNHRLGTSFNVKRIYRIQSELDLLSIINRKKRVNNSKSKPEHEQENILNREFNAEKPNEKWCTDVTEFKTLWGIRAYLSAIIDLYDNSIIAYEISRHNDTPLVLNTFNKAILTYPTAQPLAHADRGCQYTSYAYKAFCDHHNIRISMSRPGKCIDNAPIERFWATLKASMPGFEKIRTEKELYELIEKRIEFYNNKRLQARFNNQSPMVVRQHALHQLSINQAVNIYKIKENKKITKYWEKIEEKKIASNA